MNIFQKAYNWIKLKLVVNQFHASLTEDEEAIYKLNTEMLANEVVAIYGDYNRLYYNGDGSTTTDDEKRERLAILRTRVEHAINYFRGIPTEKMPDALLSHYHVYELQDKLYDMVELLDSIELALDVVKASLDNEDEL